MILRRWIYPLSLALGALLVLVAPSVAQHSQPQQQRVGLYLTQVIRSDQRISRTRVLYLPPLAAGAITTKPSSGGTGGGSGKSGGGKSGGGSTGCPTTSKTSYTYSVGCPVAPTTSSPEAEEEIAADPAGATNYVAAVSDFSLRGGYNTTKWAITTDGGSTWSQNFVPLGAQNDPETSDGTLWAANSDPDLAIGQSGNVYLSDLYVSANAFPNGVYVSSGTIASLSGGSNFVNTEPVMLNTTTYDSTNPNENDNSAGSVCNPSGPTPFTSGEFCLEDKPWVAVDNSTSATDATRGVVYVVWDHFWACNALLGVVACNGGPDIYLSYSTNHGLTWSAPITIDTGTIPTGQSQSGNVEAPQVAVGPDGTVYIAFEAFEPGSNTRWQYLTWSKPTESTSGSTTILNFDFASTLFNATPNGFLDLSFSATYRVNSFPSLAIGPGGQVYLEYADQPLSNSQVEFVSCSPAPTTCSNPMAIGSPTATGQQFFPAISVDSNGTIHSSWFDTRNSANNTADFDVYAAFNSGSGWPSSPTRVTPTTINTGVASFIGDYSGIAVGSPGVAHPVWNDFSETCGRLTCRYSGTMQSATLTAP